MLRGYTMAYYADMGNTGTLCELSALAYLKQPNKTLEHAFNRIEKCNVYLWNIRKKEEKANKYEKYLKLFNENLNIWMERIFHVPVEFRSKKMCYELIRYIGSYYMASNNIFKFIPNTIKTKKFYEYWCSCNDDIFCYILTIFCNNNYSENEYEAFYVMEEDVNKRYVPLDEVIIMGYSNSKNKLENIFLYIPTSLITKEICTLIFSFDGLQLSKLKQSKYLELDADMCLAAVKQNFNVIFDIPKKYLTKEICRVVF